MFLLFLFPIKMNGQSQISRLAMIILLLWPLSGQGMDVELVSRNFNVEEFHTAFNNGTCSPDLLKEALSHNVDLFARDANGYTLLHRAYYNTELMEILLDHGLDPNSSGYYSEITPLFMAALKGNIDACNLLLGRGANIDLGCSPLLGAARNGHCKVCKLFLDLGANVSKRYKSAGPTDVIIYPGIEMRLGDLPLLVAAKYGHVDVCELLLDKGANANECSQSGRTPLVEAALNGDMPVCLLLLNRCAEVNKCTADGFSPLRAAAESGSLEVCTLFLNRGACVHGSGNRNRSTPLAAAAQNGHTSICLFLLEFGADVHCGKKGHWTPLYLAALNGRANVCDFLLGRGANVNEGSDRCTPLGIAAEKGFVDVCSVLISWGADLQKGSTPIDGDKYSTSCLFGAARTGQAEICRLLLQQGAAANALLNQAVSGDYSGEITKLIVVHQGRIPYYYRSEREILPSLRKKLNPVVGVHIADTPYKRVVMAIWCLKKIFEGLSDRGFRVDPSLKKRFTACVLMVHPKLREDAFSLMFPFLIESFSSNRHSAGRDLMNVYGSRLIEKIFETTLYSIQLTAKANRDSLKRKLHDGKIEGAIVCMLKPVNIKEHFGRDLRANICRRLNDLANNKCGVLWLQVEVPAEIASASDDYDKTWYNM